MNDQPTFFPMAFPIQGPSIREGQPPARVRLAVDFLALLIHKQSPRPAVNDISIEWSEGQKLIGSEIEAQIAACDLLTRYFEGKLRPDSFERKGTEDRGALVNCPACYGRDLGGAICSICLGQDKVYLKPVGGKGS